MKKLILSLAIVATLTLIACSNNGQEKTVAPVSKPTANTQAIKVTRDYYQYAEAIRNAENYIKLGGENKWAHFRDLSPIGSSAHTIRMNLDTLYSVSVFRQQHT